MAAKRDTLLGLVFFGGLGLLGWATVTLTSLSLEPKPTVTARFANALGLRTGDPVFVLGTRLGQVAEVSLDPVDGASPILVVMELTRDVALYDDCRVEIRASSLLGGMQIDIQPGSSGTPAQPPLAGETRGGVLDTLGDADLAGTLESVKTLFDKLADPDGTVGALLESRAAFDDLSAALASLRSITAAIERGDGTLGRLVTSRELAEDVSGAVATLRDIMTRIDRGDGLVARLLNDPALAEDLAGALADVRELTAMARRGDGLLGRLLTDGAMAAKLDDTLGSLRAVAAKLDDPAAGLAGALLGDRELLARGRSLLANLDAITAKIDQGRGMLGKLINDEQLGERLERLFVQVTGALEDVREAAPVGTFFQVLAGPF